MRAIWKVSAIVLWLVAAFIGFPLLILLAWLLSSESDFSTLGLVVLAVGFVLLGYGAVALFRFVGRP